MPRTRERQLAKLAARRAAERRKKRRQRIAAGVVGGLVAVAGIGFGLSALLGGDEPGNGASPTPSIPLPTTPTTTPSPPAAAVACGAEVPPAAGEEKQTYPEAPEMTIDTALTYTMTMETSCGPIVIELDPELAPNTVNSLVFLAGEGFYDGLTFHRIARDFVIQGGDPLGDGTGGPGYQTVDPPPEGFAYERGMVAMAKAGADPTGAAGSQFFVVTGDPSALTSNPVYAVVGRVTEGMDAADTIAALPIQTEPDGPPVQSAYIETVTVAEAP